MPGTSTVVASSDGPFSNHATGSTWKVGTSFDQEARKRYHWNSFRPLRKALGVIGTLSIVAGTLVVLGTLAFLIFLWTGEGLNEGEDATPLWRTIALGQWLTQVITLCAVVLRFTNAIQASVCTGLVAALILER